MSALLNQIDELLYEHHENCRCMSCWVYKISINEKEFESEKLSEVVALAWSEAVHE
jgi:hypothetical protein